MKIQALYDLQQEINRLYIAGSKFAKNDPRLTKQIPVLNKLGEKAPVFKKLAQSLEELTQAETVESSEKLLNLGILLYSVLYTQGETTEENVDQSELNFSVDLEEMNTSVSFLELKPVIEALTSTTQGRMAVVQNAFNQGIFNDFRTFHYLNLGLNDKYSELADYIEKTIVPSIGRQMHYYIKKNFSYEGRPEDVRRFRLLFQLQDKEIDKMIKTVLEGSAVNLQAEAVKMLAGNIENEALIITLAGDKHKPVRESAYWALAQLNTETSLEKLVQVFLKNKNINNLEGIVAAIQCGEMSFFLEDVYKKIRSDFEAFCSMDNEPDDKKWVAALDQLSIEFHALENKKEEYIIRFWEEWLTNDKFNRLINKKKNLPVNSAQTIVRAICVNLGRINNETTRQTLKRLFEHSWVQKNWWDCVSVQYFPAATQEFGKEKIYDLFRQCFKEGGLPVHTLADTYTNGNYSLYDVYDTYEKLNFDSEKIDKRWLDLFLSKFDDAGLRNQPELIFLIISCAGVQSDYSRKALKKYMEAVVKDKQLPYNQSFIYVTDKLMESGLSQRFELLTAALENNKYPTYNSEIYKYISEAAYLKDFPKEYSNRFREIYRKCNGVYYLDIAGKIDDNPGKFQHLINKMIKV